MTNSQRKKIAARNYNMARIEVAAIKMDAELFPRLSRPTSRAVKNHVLMYTAMTGGIGLVNYE